MSLVVQIILAVILVPCLMFYLVTRENDYGRIRYRIRAYNLNVHSQFTVVFILLSISFLILNPTAGVEVSVGFASVTIAGILLTLASSTPRAMVSGLTVALLGGVYFLRSLP